VQWDRVEILTRRQVDAEEAESEKEAELRRLDATSTVQCDRVKFDAASGRRGKLDVASAMGYRLNGGRKQVPQFQEIAMNTNKTPIFLPALNTKTRFFWQKCNEKGWKHFR